MTLAEIFKDFRRNYNGCYVFVRPEDSDEELMYRIEEIDDSNNPTMTLRSQEHGMLVLNVGSASKLFFKAKRVGMFQHEREAMFCSHQFGQGWSRGVSSTNTVISSFGSGMLSGRVEAEEFERRVASMYKAKTYSLADAIIMLDQYGYLSVAISNTMSIAHSLLYSKGYTLRYKHYLLAELDENAKITELRAKHFKPYIEKVLYDNH